MLECVDQPTECDTCLEVDVFRVKLNSATLFNFQYDVQQPLRVDQPNLYEMGRIINAAVVKFRVRSSRGQQHRQNCAADDIALAHGVNQDLQKSCAIYCSGRLFAQMFLVEITLTAAQMGFQVLSNERMRC